MDTTGGLPYTGLDMGMLLVIVGVVLIIVGAVIRMRKGAVRG